MKKKNAVASVEPNFSKAVTHHHAGRVKEAEQLYRKVLKASPKHVATLTNLAIIKKQEGDEQEAFNLYNTAHMHEPDNIHALMGLAGIKVNRQLYAEAIALYQKALSIRPTDTHVLFKLGTAMLNAGDGKEAVEYYKKLLEIDPDHADTLVNIGVATRNLGRIPESIVYLEKACALGQKEAILSLSWSYILNNQNMAALRLVENALEADPHLPKAWGKVATALYRQGRIEEAIIASEKELLLEDDSHVSLSNHLFIMHFSPRFSMEEIYKVAQEWGEKFAKPLTPPRDAWPKKQGAADKRLRVGFVSPDFRRHPVSHFFLSFIEAIKEHHNWDSVLYADVPDADNMTVCLEKAAKEFYHIAALSDEALAEKIRNDNIDILFDLCGHTGRNRLQMFAMKPAPLQVTWLGYFDTTGMEAMDYLLADPITIPQGTEQFYSERIIRMPENFLCYTPSSWAPEVSPLPALNNGYITFGSANQLAKLTDEVIALWSKTVNAVPGAKLALKTKGLSDEETRQRLYRLFKEAGLAEERLILHEPGIQIEILQFYQTIDIALDPFPCVGGTTTCEALWMGIPVITMLGERFCNRHSASHLWNAGMRGLVARTEEEYINIAKEMSADIQKLASLRQKIREVMAKSPLTDAARFADNFAIVLRKIWQDDRQAT